MAAFELHLLSPFPSKNRVEEAFLYRLGRMVQTLGYTPLFVLDRGFDRVSLMRKLKGWGMAFLIRLQRNRRVETDAGERFVLGECYPMVPRPERRRSRLFGHNGNGVTVELFLAQGKREPWYLAFWTPLDSDWAPGGYRLRMWIEEGFRDLKGQGFGLDRHRLRTAKSPRGWLWLLALGMVLLILFGTLLWGRAWLPRVVAHLERQSLFRLARIVLAQGSPPLRKVALRVLRSLLEQLAKGGGK